MIPLVLLGLLAMGGWAAWVLYIAEKQRPVTVSLLLTVQQGEQYLDPLLRQVSQLFRQSSQLDLREIWVLAADEGEEARRIVHRLNRDLPLLHFRSSVRPGELELAEAKGQVLVILDLVNRLTPLAAVQAVARLLAAGPTPPGTIALTSGD